MTRENSFHIRDLMLPEETAKDYRSDGKDPRLRNLNKLNIFIGPNNSGKSRLLRQLFHTTPYFYVSTSESNESLRTDTQRLYEYVMIAGDGDEKQKLENILCNFALNPVNQGNVQAKNAIKPNVKSVHPHHGENLGVYQKAQKIIGDSEDVVGLAASIGQRWSHLLENPTSNQNVHFTRIYIPSLRSARAFGENGVLFHQKANEYFSNAYKFKGEDLDSHSKDGNIITGVEIYDYAKSQLLGDWEYRDRYRRYEEFLSKRFFRGEKISLVPRLDYEELHIKIGHEKERPLRDLGDGINNIVVMTMPIFLYSDDDLLLFIDEPELYLHPGYQRVLAELFLDSVLGKHQVFISTHSTVFLDITLDQEQCSVYRVSKDGGPNYAPIKGAANFQINQISNDDTNVLKELGVKNSSLFLSNCTIWVEGITDRLYFRKYLKLYHEQEQVDCQWQEDIHYSFVEYSGSNISHWSFSDDATESIYVDRICNNILLIADYDSGKEARHAALSTSLGDRYLKLPCREVENLLSPKVIVCVVREYEGNSTENILTPSSQTIYRTRYLGRYIDKHVLKDQTLSKRYRDGSEYGPYSDKSGTIKDKMSFCDRALNFLESWGDLSEDAKSVTLRMIKFISESNK